MRCAVAVASDGPVEAGVDGAVGGLVVAVSVFGVDGVAVVLVADGLLCRACADYDFDSAPLGVVAVGFGGLSGFLDVDEAPVGVIGQFGDGRAVADFEFKGSDLLNSGI